MRELTARPTKYLLWRSQHTKPTAHNGAILMQMFCCQLLSLPWLPLGWDHSQKIFDTSKKSDLNWRPVGETRDRSYKDDPNRIQVTVFWLQFICNGRLNWLNCTIVRGKICNKIVNSLCFRLLWLVYMVWVGVCVAHGRNDTFGVQRDLVAVFLLVTVWQKCNWWYPEACK